MDWPLIVERNRERLLAVLAPLFAVLGFDPRRADLPRHLYRALLITLRPAESAVRRLIIIAAHGIIVKLLALPAPFRRALLRSSGLHWKRMRSEFRPFS